ncbi:hypothetical protein [Flavobacterium sp.]|uniref:hypothetical protein n=1 Tax=Flavobacterium sp. TaxID=239 RepID=UPI00260DD0A4|nr:hypothetical protein [Flavobacterium sp.]
MQKKTIGKIKKQPLIIIIPIFILTVGKLFIFTILLNQKMKSFATIVLLFFVMFLFKPSILTIIEKGTEVSIAKDLLEDDSNEEKKIASFYKPNDIYISNSEETVGKNNIHSKDFSLPNILCIKIHTPPPKN